MKQSDFVEEYKKVIEYMEEYANDIEQKVDGFVALASEMEKMRDRVPRNDLLDIHMSMAELKSRFNKFSDRMKASTKWCSDAILLKLQEEELDNYKYKGKLFYPSRTPRYSVNDRGALNEFIEKHGAHILGNTLNKEEVVNVIETTGDLPPGISSYTQLTLNMRKS